MAWARQALRLVAVNLAVLGGLLVVTEGMASYALLARDLLTRRPVTKRQHTTYDADLGWVNMPNLDLPDMYGPGRWFRTNRRGFRNSQEVEAAVPPGQIRLICSGDSFTLGYGVSNDHTWCHLLTGLDARLETVNMGQGGDGVDQAYLWYRRDGVPLAHQVHLFAFITDDLYRMQTDRCLGYGKPVLAVVDGRLAVANVPVPTRAYAWSWLTTHAQVLHRLRVVQALTPGSGTSADAAPRGQSRKNAQTQAVLRLIFEDLQRLHDRRGSRLILVYLPTQREIREPEPHPWVEWISCEAQALGIPFINVLGAVRALPYPEATGLFRGHYNEAGHAFVARVIYEGLTPHLGHKPRHIPSDLVVDP